jgi:hypothetical protein
MTDESGRSKQFEINEPNMKNLLIPHLPHLSFVFALAFPWATDVQQPDQNATLYRQAAMIVNDVKAFDKGTGHKTLETFMIPYPSLITQKTKVTVTIADKVIRKLTYVSYDEGNTASGVETYYFNANGKFVCHVNKATGLLSYDVYVDSVLVLWTKADDPTNRVI